MQIKDESDEIKLTRERLEFMYKVLHDKLDYIDKSYESLREKCNYMLGITGVAASFYITVLVQNNLLSNVTSIQLWFFHALPLLLLLTTLGSFIIALQVRNYSDPPDIEVIYSENAYKPHVFDLKSDVLSSMKVAYNDNLKNLEATGFWFSLGLGLLFITIWSIFLSLIMK